jgi:predicted membrane metal-binding protein
MSAISGQGMNGPGPRFAILNDASPPDSQSTTRRLTTLGIAAFVTISGLVTALLLSLATFGYEIR